MARKGILTTGPTSDTGTPRRPQAAQTPRGTVGALASSLNRLQENAVQEIDPQHIHNAGVADRLGTDEAADTALKASIETYGQQVPVLVRPRDGEPGQYDIVYGRRRVLAMRELGLPVKAMVRHLDDRALVLAQGQENTARQDLSFIEKASFAAQLDALDYDRQTIADALSMDLPMVSRMLKVGRAFALDLLVQIGSAPGIGRERWMKLVEAMTEPAAAERVDSRLPALHRPFRRTFRTGAGLGLGRSGPQARQAPCPKGAQDIEFKRLSDREGQAWRQGRHPDRAPVRRARLRAMDRHAGRRPDARALRPLAQRAVGRPRVTEQTKKGGTKEDKKKLPRTDPREPSHYSHF